jgi:hypothetical protein
MMSEAAVSACRVLAMVAADGVWGMAESWLLPGETRWLPAQN